MSGDSFCVIDRFWKQWYYGVIDIIVQINSGLLGWTQRATPDSDCYAILVVAAVAARQSERLSIHEQARDVHSFVLSRGSLLTRKLRFVGMDATSHARLGLSE